MEYSKLVNIAGGSVFFSWFIFGIAFIVVFIRWIDMKKAERSSSQKKIRSSVLGIIFQFIGFTILFSVHRNMDFTVNRPGIMLHFFTWFAIFLAPVSTFFLIYSIISLGKQWSLSARIRNDHQLITSGPFRYVRHPVYFCLFGMFISSGIIGTAFIAFVISTVIFIYGTILRIREEEKLLIEVFGEKYESYRKKVRAFIPFIY